MKKTQFLVIVMCAGIALFSCKNAKKEDTQTVITTTETPVTTDTKSNTTAAEPKTYSITAVPDSASLGKSKEVFIKIKNLKAIQLSDPEGKETGIELSYDIDATNKTAIGGNSVVIDPSKFRLLLDNGTQISHESYNSAAIDPESTKTAAENKFKLPVGAKPASLNLFYDETRATIKLSMN